MHLTNYTFFNPKNYLYGKPVKGLRGYGLSYRFAFNGQEKDDETQTQDYGFRIYNNILGRFLSIDPVTFDYPMLTPYQFASNRPIDGIDLDGLEYIRMREWTQDYNKGGVGAIFANVVANTVIASVNGVTGVALGVKDITIYTYKATIGQRDFVADAKSAYNGISSSVSKFIAKPLQEQISIATSPEAYGALVNFFSFGGAKTFTNVKNLPSPAKLTSQIYNTYKATTFEEIIKGATNITTKGSKEMSFLINGNAQDAFGGLMKKFGKTIDDLTVKTTKTGSSFTFEADGAAYTLYNQTSASAKFVDLTISVKKGNAASVKLRFTEE